MPLSSSRKCATCGKPLVYSGVGKPSKFCPAHRPQKNRDRATAVKQLEKMRAAQLEGSAAKRVEEFTADRGGDGKPSPAWHARLLAVGLGLDADPVRAGALMGLSLTPSSLRALAVEAGRHKDLIDRKPGAIGALLLTAIGVGSVRLAAGMDSVPVSQLPGALRAVAQSVELIQGSTTPAYSEIRLVVRAPEGSTWTTTSPPTS